MDKKELYKQGEKIFGKNFKEVAAWLCSKLIDEDMCSAMDLMEDIANDY